MKGLVSERNFPDDPVFIKNNPDKVTRCPAPCLGYSPLQTQLVDRPDQATPPASPSRSPSVRSSSGSWSVSASASSPRSDAGKVADRGLVGASLILYSFPTFFIALLAYNYLSTQWQLFGVPTYVPLTQNPSLWFQGLLLPVDDPGGRLRRGRTSGSPVPTCSRR